MPSPTHEGIVDLFRKRRSLAPELLAGVLGQSLPPWTAVGSDEGTVPKLVVPNHADLVTLLLDGAGSVVAAVIVEVQLWVAAEKCWVWPLYWAALRARHRCQLVLLVVAVDAAVAEWALTVVADTGPNARFAPVVLGPAAIPWITDPEAAAQTPELAVLSAIAHGNEPGGLLVALAAIAGVAQLDPVTATAYHDLIQHALSEAARTALEALMAIKGYEYQSEFAKKHQAEGQARALLSVLQARGLAVTDAQRDQVLACTDRAVLDGWIARAAVATSMDDVLG